MVRQRDHHGTTTPAREIDGSPDGLIEGKDIAYHPHGVVGVRGPVYLASFHEQEEAFRVLRQDLHRLTRHFRQAWFVRREALSVEIDAAFNISSLFTTKA